jgi:hypothetical protein
MCHSCVKVAGKAPKSAKVAVRTTFRRPARAAGAASRLARRTLAKGSAGVINVRRIQLPGPQTMTDTPPDRLSVNPRSPHYDAEVLARDVGIRFNGVEKNNVEEYCVSEGWIRVEAGKSKDRFGNPLTIKLSGRVEPYFRDQPQS